ncbi:MAG: glutathione S-transferase family protein [Polyangiales bacterium]
MNRLITLAFSHYNEKARWALDRFRVPYRDERHLPFVCSMAVAVATRGRGGAADRTSSKFSTPVLILDDGRKLTDSTDIARFAAGDDASFFPNQEVASLVDHYGDRLGPYTRALAYWHVLRHPGMIEQLADDNVSARQARLFRSLMPLVRSNLTRAFNLTEASRDKAMTRLRTELDGAAARLERSPYLYGDQFTAADLTFAALLGPALCVTPEEGYSAVLPSIDALDADARALVDETRSHPAGRFALRMFAEERRA